MVVRFSAALRFGTLLPSGEKMPVPWGLPSVATDEGSGLAYWLGSIGAHCSSFRRRPESSDDIVRWSRKAKPMLSRTAQVFTTGFLPAQE